MARRINVAFLLSLLILAALWEVAGRTAGLMTLPPLSAVCLALIRLFAAGALTEPLLDSTLALLAGLGISLSLGSVLGIAIGLSRTCAIVLGPLIKAGLCAPMIAFVPVFMMLFGIGQQTRIATVVAFSLFVVATHAITAIRAADHELINMAASFGADGKRLLWEVRLPAGAPVFLAGLQLGVARGIKGLINGEVLIAVMGLGGLVKKYGTVFSMESLYAVILFILLYAVCLIHGTRFAATCLARRYRSTAPSRSKLSRIAL